MTTGLTSLLLSNCDVNAFRTEYEQVSNFIIKSHQQKNNLFIKITNQIQSEQEHSFKIIILKAEYAN